MVKKGDTLIEVTLAVGIFSMVAVAVTAVMSSGTSGAQTALETTLAREEIDTQAEALRFIQTAYSVDKDSADKRYADLWNTITANAITLSDVKEQNEEILQFTPSTCEKAYDNKYTRNKAFVINPRVLGTFGADTIDTVYIGQANASNSDKFGQTQTYPRLVFKKNNNEENKQSLVADTSSYTTLDKAEGIYVIAVKDKNTTSIYNGNQTDKTSAFYDFYIRACWYGSDADQPSTISTVIRLADPKAVEAMTTP